MTIELVTNVARAGRDRPQLQRRAHRRALDRDTLTLPDDTVVHTGHGESTTIGAERGPVLALAAELGV